MKTLLKISAICLFLVACKKDDVDTKDLKYTVIENHFVNFDRNSRSDARGFIAPGTDNSVVFYDSNPEATKECCDGGAFFVAFEIPSGVNSFAYNDSLALSNAHCIAGMTSSIAGPMIEWQTIGEISGKKISDSTWEISILIPETGSRFAHSDILLKERFLIVK